MKTQEAINCTPLELSTFLRALEAGYSPTYYSDTSQSAPSKSMPIASKSYRHGNKTVVFPGFPSLTMCKPLTASPGADLSMLLPGASHARTSALPEKAQGWTENAADYGASLPASLARYDPDTHSLKTAQHSFLEDLTGCSVTLPRSGWMRDGECWELPTLVPRTSGNESGLWPTPTVCGNYNRKGASASSGDGLATAVSQRTYPTATATAYKGWSPNHNRADTDDRLDYTVERDGFNPGQQTPPKRLNPDWTEWLMGWPIGQTALEPLATAKFHEWLQQHGGY